MEPVFNLAGIEKRERRIRKRRHAILLLLIKPSDSLSTDIIPQFNYYHFASGKYCSIYAPGYSVGPFSNGYDSRKTAVVEGKEWFYSDRCFVEFQSELEKRLKWRYCGEPEIIILQSGLGKHSALDFTNYASLDVMRGLREGYIDSFSRLMQELINASKTEVEAKDILKEAKRLSAQDIVNTAIEVATPIPDAIQNSCKIDCSIELPGNEADVKNREGISRREDFELFWAYAKECVIGTHQMAYPMTVIDDRRGSFLSGVRSVVLISLR